jgi:transcriptional regulator with XRE-family HTH domain
METNTRFVISQNIRHRRIASRVSQLKLAASVNYSRKWLSGVENGRGSIPAECLPTIAKTLNTTITDLYIPGRFYGED